MKVEKMLQDTRNYLDITYEDNDTDVKLLGIIRRGADYLDRVAGTPQDYNTDSAAKSLLLDYCRYARNNALELFEQNFRAELIMLRIGVQTGEYAERQE
jgi:hypothetical protein|nr:MAG TPA: Head Tail Connector Protein [Caudoviricetes sp.]